MNKISQKKHLKKKKQLLKTLQKLDKNKEYQKEIYLNLDVNPIKLTI